MRQALRGGLARVGLYRRGRFPGLRTAKTTLAAVLAYLLALQLHGEPKPVLAPLTALLVVQLTLYETLKGSLQRIVSVVAGVLVAVLFASVASFTVASLGLLVAASLLVGKLLRLGPQLMEVPISAMLVLAVGGNGGAAYLRILETLVGAAVGVVVSLLIAPPLYIQPAGDAIGELAEAMARLLRQMAGRIVGGWSPADAQGWLHDARELGRYVRRAEDALARAEQSVRLHPRKPAVGHAPPPLRSGLVALEHTVIQLRVLCRTLADRAQITTDEGEPGSDVRRRFAELLYELAAVCAAFGEFVAPDVTGPPRDDAPLRAVLDRARQRRNELADAMLVDSGAEPTLWRLHGALLADIDWLIQELDPEAGSEARAARRQQARLHPWRELVPYRRRT